MIKKADMDLEKAKGKVEKMQMMLVEAQNDLNKSKEMFESAS